MDDVATTDLLARAAGGDQAAWNGLVDRFGRLVWSVTRGFRLDSATAADVSQTVWLRLAENCERIRDPERLAGWLATTARNESLRVLRRTQRDEPTEMLDDRPDVGAPVLDERLLDDETLGEALDAFRQLSDDQQLLLRLLCADPPLGYERISEITGRPVGSIGPTRARCLERLRRLMDESADNTKGGA
ncbi:MAG: sigma-70 family RNA polymerase sigma factor [Acidimicrobiia bacterium]|nr:sigma-70 family RNA polymerase sigma factor [Acidimicrobiia bacterium]